MNFCDRKIGYLKKKTIRFQSFKDENNDTNQMMLPFSATKIPIYQQKSAGSIELWKRNWNLNLSDHFSLMYPFGM